MTRVYQTIPSDSHDLLAILRNSYICEALPNSAYLAHPLLTAIATFQYRPSTPNGYRLASISRE